MSNELTEWKNLPLNKIFDIARGGSPRPIKNYITEDEDGINWIKIGDTKNSSKYIYNTKQKIKSEGVKKSQLVKEDDFILSNSMSFGKPYIMKTRGCIHDGWLVLRKMSKETSIDYMYYLLSSSVIKNQFENKAAGSTVRNLNIKLVSSVKVSIPPYQEQQKIADILSTVDEKIAVIDQQITATEALKKGLMQRLLTKGIGHTEFKDSPLGKIPKSWEVKEIAKCLKLQGGYAFKSKDSVENGVPWLKIANVGVNRIKWKDLSFLPKTFKELYPEFVLNIGDVVIAMTRPILSGKLKIAIIQQNDAGALLNQRVGRISLISDEIDISFAYHFLNSKKFIGTMEKELIGTDPPNISSSLFESLNIIIPPKDEQLKISEIIDSVSNKKIFLVHKRKKYQELKKGLMQQLLTGKIRVNNLIEA